MIEGAHSHPTFPCMRSSLYEGAQYERGLILIPHPYMRGLILILFTLV